MEHVFIKSKDGEHRTSEYIQTEEELKTAINENTINKYTKVPRVKLGDYMTCCELFESIFPNSPNHDEYNSHSWEMGKVVRVDEVDYLPWAFYILSNLNSPMGIYTCGVRFATEDEITEFKKRYE